MSQGKTCNSVLKIDWNGLMGPAGFTKEVRWRKVGMWIIEVAAWSNLGDGISEAITKSGAGEDKHELETAAHGGNGQDLGDGGCGVGLVAHLGEDTHSREGS